MLKLVSAIAFTVIAVTRIGGAAPHPLPNFGNPVPVTIQGYTGDAMEPFISTNGKYLFFNNRNDPGTDTNLFYARRISKTKFAFLGQINGANSAALDAVPSMDSANSLYFVSTRSYSQTLSTIYRGSFSRGTVLNVSLVPGISKLIPLSLNFDAGISPDGNTMYFVDSEFTPAGQPTSAALVVAQKNPTGFARLSNSTQLLASVNTTGALQYGAAISKNGRDLYFTRAVLPLGSSNPEIYVTTRTSTTSAFGAPAPLTALTGFVEAPTLSPNGRGLYYHKLVGSRYVIYRASRL